MILWIGNLEDSSAGATWDFSCSLPSSDGSTEAEGSKMASLTHLAIGCQLGYHVSSPHELSSFTRLDRASLWHGVLILRR